MKEILSTVGINFTDFRVKEKPSWWHLVPLSGRNRFNAFSSTTVYLTPALYTDYVSNNPKASTKAAVVHELVHMRQLRAEGPAFNLRYILSRKHRLRYEVEAYAIQAIARQNLGLEVKRWLNRRVSVLASWRYLYLGGGPIGLVRSRNIWRALSEFMQTYEINS